MIEESATVDHGARSQVEWLLHVDILPDDVTDLVPVQLPADRTPALVYVAGMSRRSRRVMYDGLAIAVAILTAGSTAAGWNPANFPWQQLRFAHVNAVRAILLEARSASTANRVLSAVRGVLKDCWRLQLMTTDDYMRAVDVKSIKGEQPDQAAGRMLAPGEMQALFHVCGCDPSPAGVRDAAILGLAAFAGLRRTEIVDLQLDHWQPAADTAPSPAAPPLGAGTLKVRGKGNKTRSLPVTAGLAAALADWIHLRGTWPGPLFTAINKGGVISDQALSDQTVYALAEKRRVEANVSPFSPHDMRRTFISEILDAGVDLSTVQRLAGHADANTTAGYDRRNEIAKINAVNRLHMPYQRRYA